MRQAQATLPAEQLRAVVAAAEELAQSDAGIPAKSSAVTKRLDKWVSQSGVISSPTNATRTSASAPPCVDTHHNII